MRSQKRTICRLLLFIFIPMLVASGNAVAQSREAFAEFSEHSVPAFFIEMPAAKSVVADILQEQMESLGIKPKEQRDNYFKCIKVKHPQLSLEYIDIYYKFNEANVNEVKNTQVTFIVSKGYENYINAQVDSSLSNNVKELLNNLLIGVQRKNMEAEIEKQAKLLQDEKNTLLTIETATQKLETEKQELELKIKKSTDYVNRQATIVKNIGDRMAMLRKTLGEFEEKTKAKTKGTLKVVSTQ